MRFSIIYLHSNREREMCYVLTFNKDINFLCSDVKNILCKKNVYKMYIYK